MLGLSLRFSVFGGLGFRVYGLRIRAQGSEIKSSACGFADDSCRLRVSALAPVSRRHYHYPSRHGMHGREPDHRLHVHSVVLGSVVLNSANAKIHPEHVKNTVNVGETA